MKTHPGNSSVKNHTLQKVCRKRTLPTSRSKQPSVSQDISLGTVFNEDSVSKGYSVTQLLLDD